ncbi:hypothetical protein [Microcoleus sp. CAWBG58]|nr:hypothetical protein [Microcoleus sp. CAWBG58]
MSCPYWVMGVVMIWGCWGDRHKLRSRSKCPNCGAKFKVPALWADS